MSEKMKVAEAENYILKEFSAYTRDVNRRIDQTVFVGNFDPFAIAIEGISERIFGSPEFPDFAKFLEVNGVDSESFMKFQ